jgi:hypothetical protein
MEFAGNVLLGTVPELLNAGKPNAMLLPEQRCTLWVKQEDVGICLFLLV